MGKNGSGVLNTSHGSRKEVTVICWHLELWCGVLDALFDAGLIDMGLYQNMSKPNKYWLVVWKIFFHILGIIIPTD